MLAAVTLIVQAMVSGDVDAASNLVKREGANIKPRRASNAIYFAPNGLNADYRSEMFMVRSQSTATGLRILSAQGPVSLSSARILLSQGPEGTRDYTPLARVGGPILWDVPVLEAVPQLLVGRRAGISLAIIIVVEAERFIGSSDGLGHCVINAHSLFEAGLMHGVIVVAGALGYGMNVVLIIIENRLVHWAGR